MNTSKLHQPICLITIMLCLSFNSIAENKFPTLALNKESKTQSLLKAPVKSGNFKTIEWVELIPKEELDILLNPPSYITDVEDGSLEDQIASQIQSSFATAEDDSYQQALVSTNVILAMDNQSVRIPGFIVPLEYNDDQAITQFFLVPYFGACIHLPPPPPNQIIFVEYPKGMKLETIYEPLWISGLLKASIIENEVATSAYSLKMENHEVYKEN